VNFKIHENLRQASGADDPRVALARCQKQLMRVQIELAELKRTGSHQGLTELTSEALILSMRIKSLEYLLEQG
jgi:hypothetical protein